MLDNLEKDLLEKVAGIKDKPQGAYNIVKLLIELLVKI